MRRSLGALGACVLAAGSLAACGSSGTSSESARSLLRDTFATDHTVKSGVIDLDIDVTPHGSSLLSSPLSLTLSGPFQSQAHGTPESNLAIALHGLGKSLSFGVITTPDAAFLRLQGTPYTLPRSEVQSLTKGLSGATDGSAPGLATLGIDPSHWLLNPRVIGTQTIDGTRTEHVRAGVNVSALLADIDRLLARESSTASKAGVPTRIPPSTVRTIVTAVQNPTVDVWTGAKDRTLRQLTLGAHVPVTGTISRRLGGLRSADVRLDLSYAQINRPQSIAAPAHARSAAALQSALGNLGAQLEGALGSSTGAGAGASSGATTGSGTTSKYAKCINTAGGDVAKMQRCAGLLSSGG